MWILSGGNTACRVLHKKQINFKTSFGLLVTGLFHTLKGFINKLMLNPKRTLPYTLFQKQWLVRAHSYHLFPPEWRAVSPSHPQCWLAAHPSARKCTQSFCLGLSQVYPELLEEEGSLHHLATKLKQEKGNACKMLNYGWVSTFYIFALSQEQQNMGWNN